jgi:hypothetical protein
MTLLFQSATTTELVDYNQQGCNDPSTVLKNLSTDYESDYVFSQWYSTFFLRTPDVFSLKPLTPKVVGFRLYSL